MDVLVKYIVIGPVDHTTQPTTLDPDDVLHRLRDEARVALCGEDVSPVAMAEAFQALDDWLCRGGFLPTDWAPRP